MKNTLILLFAFFVLTGCRTRYDITLTNGGKITGTTKPKIDPATGFYVFKDASGRTNYLPVVRVSVIEPQDRWRQEEQDAAKNFQGDKKKKD